MPGVIYGLKIPISGRVYIRYRVPPGVALARPRYALFSADFMPRPLVFIAFYRLHPVFAGLFWYLLVIGPDK